MITFRRILVSSRFFVLLAVVGSFIASLVTLIAGVVAVLTSTAALIRSGGYGVKSAKSLGVDVLQVIDIFLVGAVLYIMALGIYELFIDPEFPAPGWLKIETLDDLKERLVAVVVVMLSVTFLAYVVDLQATSSILEIGAAIGAVLVGLGVYFKLAGGNHS